MTPPIDYDRLKQKILFYSHGTITPEEADRMISTLQPKPVETKEKK
jgi:hypothetical protein